MIKNRMIYCKNNEKYIHQYVLNFNGSDALTTATLWVASDDLIMTKSEFNKDFTSQFPEEIKNTYSIISHVVLIND